MRTKEDIILYQKKYREAHKENNREYAREYRKKYPERIKEMGEKWRNNNRQKLTEDSRIYKKLHPDKVAISKAKSRKIILEKIELSVSRKKPDKCEICNRGGRICFDHDHKNGKFRGWICYRCNLALGLMEDNVHLLKKLIKYLE